MLTELDVPRAAQARQEMLQQVRTVNGTNLGFGPSFAPFDSSGMKACIKQTESFPCVCLEA